MRKRFSALLLTGKAATLPALIQQAHAYIYYPSYTEVLSSSVSQIEVPEPQKIEPQSPGNSLYNGTVTLCSNSGTVANQLSLVITGLKNNDSVYVIAATDLGGNEYLDPRIKIGSKNLMLPTTTGVTAAEGSTIAMSVPLDLKKLAQNGFQLDNGGRFYLQTVVFPPTAFTLGGVGIDWTVARVSEVDVFSVGNCSTYGPHGSF